VRRVYRRLIVIVALLLAACTTTPAPPAPTPQPASGPVNLFLWHAWGGEQAQTLTQLVDAFNTSNPAVRVVPQRTPIATFADDVRAASAASGGPHLMLVPNRWLGQLAADGVLLPLDQYVPADEQRSLLPSAVAGARVTGNDATRLYGVPICVDTVVLYYNQDNYPEPPGDSEAMLRVARGLSDPAASPPRWGMAYNLSLDATVGYMYAFGGRVFDEQGALVLGTTGRAGVERWLDWQLQLSRDPELLAVPDGAVVAQQLASNQALMTIDWAHRLPVYRALWGDQLAVAPLPPLPDGVQPPAPYVVGDVAVVNGKASAAEQQAALQFVRFLLAPDAQRLLWQVGKLPALGTIGDDASWQAPGMLRAFHAQAAQGTPALNDPQAPVVERTLRQMQRDVLRGLASPADAVTQAAEALGGIFPAPAP
jgi:arabinogalactan oligomer / maltooligosaccharide transport system substrate-binding protein